MHVLPNFEVFIIFEVGVASDCAEFTILNYFQRTILLASSMHANIFLLSLGVHQVQVEPKLT